MRKIGGNCRARSDYLVGMAPPRIRGLKHSFAPAQFPGRPIQQVWSRSAEFANNQIACTGARPLGIPQSTNPAKSKDVALRKSRGFACTHRTAFLYLLVASPLG